MRTAPNHRAQQMRDLRYSDPENGNNGVFWLNNDTKVIASDGQGWDHVSVSRHDRTPTWEEMCKVKKIFFRDDEVPYQLHIDTSSKVNIHEHCLHLWRDQNQVVSQPPLEFV